MRPIVRFVLLLLAGALCTASCPAAEPAALVYTRNFRPDGKGYVHDNITNCVRAIEAMGRRGGFAVEVSNDPAVFSATNLARFAAVVFANSNDEAFATEGQRAAFQDYIRRGGGFAGIHSASGSERQCAWFSALLGGTFDWHAPLQPFTVRVMDRRHPSTVSFAGDTWQWTDEFYILKNRRPGMTVLLAGDQTTLKKFGSPMQREILAAIPEPVPMSWCHELDGGRAWYTALGHKKEYYEDPVFVKHLEGGIRWVMRLE
jgi:type 1 glutamine amidotransferase